MTQFPAVISVTALDGTNGFKLAGRTGFEAGYSVASAGDINGDGLADVIVGARLGGYGYGGLGRISTGLAYIVFGSATGFPANLTLSTLDGTDGFKVLDDQAEFAGRSVSSAGDINGDGFADVIVGAPNAGGNAGAAYVLFGKAAGFPSFVHTSALDGTDGFELTGSTGGMAGSSVSSGGDINGDGYDDLIIGSYSASPNGSGSGSTYILFGHAGSFSAQASLSTLDGHNGFAIVGNAALNVSGFSVAGAGDVNGDGFDDILVRSLSTSTTNSTLVVFGKAAAFSATFNPSALDGANGFKITGTYSNRFAFHSVDTAGDVNGDGFADIIVGEHGLGGANLSGSAYVVFGKAGGFAPNIALSAIDGTNGFKLIGTAFLNNTGFAVSSAGDVNGDGFADIIIGAYGADPDGGSSGSSYVVFGHAAGFAASINLSALDGDDGFRIDGSGAGTYSGRSVASAGDLNGDGFDDIIVGAASAHGSDSAYVIYGTAPTQAVVRTGTAIANTIHGGNFDDHLFGVGGNDVLAGGGGNDTLTGGNGDDVLNGGTGNDVLKGSAGNDSMTGGDGNDIYVVTEAGDVVVEKSGEGTDGVHTRLDSYTLGSNVENLAFSGTGPFAGTGNELGNAIKGGDGDDVIDGAGGADKLKGGAGADVFRYDAASQSTSAGFDHVVDFDGSADKVDLWFAIAHFDGRVATASLATLAVTLDSGHFAAHDAAVATLHSGQIYLVVNSDGVAGYDAGSDLLIRIDGLHLDQIGAGTFI